MLLAAVVALLAQLEGPHLLDSPHPLNTPEPLVRIRMYVSFSPTDGTTPSGGGSVVGVFGTYSSLRPLIMAAVR